MLAFVLCSEADVVILSCVRCNPEHEVGFIEVRSTKCVRVHLSLSSFPRPPVAACPQPFSSMSLHGSSGPLWCSPHPTPSLIGRYCTDSARVSVWSLYLCKSRLARTLCTRTKPNKMLASVSRRTCVFCLLSSTAGYS